jgi:hypothetical protein
MIISLSQSHPMAFMTDYFAEQVWTGTFSPVGNHSDRFSGELRFSFTDGLTLDYFYEGSPQVKGDYLTGLLMTGEKCTLIGHLPLLCPRRRMHYGFVSSRGKLGLPFAILGDFVGATPRIEKMSFTVSGMQDFFDARGREDAIKFSREPICSVATDFGSVEIRNIGDFSSTHSDITNHIHTNDPAAEAALSEKFRELLDEFPDSTFLIKKSISYKVSLNFKNHLSLDEAYKKVTAISDLFALLAYNPMVALDITFRPPDFNPKRDLKLLPYILKNNQTLGLCKQANERAILPIKSSDLNLSTVLERWLSSYEMYKTTISSIQGQTGYADLHSVHSEIILYATQLEEINKQLAGNKEKKYVLPFERYADQLLMGRLLAIFDVSDIGKMGDAIWALRGELAHIGRKKIWLNSLSLEELSMISQCLELTVISYILTSIGVPKLAVYRYQRTVIQ